MPTYSTTSPVGIYPSDQAKVWTASDTISQGSKSQAVAIGTSSGVRPSTLRYQYDATTSLGTFELDLQESDTDTDLDYQTVSSVSAAVNNSCFGQFVAPTGRFYRLLMKTLTGTVVGVGTISV